MSMQASVPSVSQKSEYRFVKYSFFKVDQEWRRLTVGEREAAKLSFLSRLREFDVLVSPRTYSTLGTRGDVDFLIWTITDSLEKLQNLHSELLKSDLGKYLFTPYSYLAMFRPSEYFGSPADHQPVGSKYLFVYPLSKKREWYSFPFEERRRMMRDHAHIGRKYPSVAIHTSYSFGLDDNEFVLSFETDHPQDFLDLVMDLRTSEASKFTAVETPIFTCLRVSPQEMLDLLV